MVRPMAIHDIENFCSLPLTMGLFVSVSVLAALCARHSKQVSRKYSTNITTDSNIAPQSPLKIITNISNKADHPYKKNGEECESHQMISNPDEGFGEGGLWQKSILMGEKCQPPEFSGVLFYDSYGNRISELPRSPRATPVRKYSSFPVAPNVQ